MTPGPVIAPAGSRRRGVYRRARKLEMSVATPATASPIPNESLVRLCVARLRWEAGLLDRRREAGSSTPGTRTRCYRGEADITLFCFLTNAMDLLFLWEILGPGMLLRNRQDDPLFPRTPGQGLWMPVGFRFIFVRRIRSLFFFSCVVFQPWVA